MERTQWAAAFRSYLQALQKSPHTVKQYVLDAEQFIEHLANQLIDAAFIESYTTMLQETYTSTNSINRKLAASRQFLAFLHSRGYVKAGLEERLNPLQKDKTALTVYSNLQVQEIRAVWPRARLMAENEEHAWLALRNGLIVELIFAFGLKPAEIVQMEWVMVDFDARKLAIRETKKSREWKLSSALLEALLYYREETRRFMPVASDVPSIWLGVGNQHGTAISVKTIERIFQFLTKSIGFKVTATNLRYAAIGRELKSAVDEVELYKQFGYARKGVLQERQERMK